MLYNRYARLYNGEKGTVALYTWWLMSKSDYLLYVFHVSEFFFLYMYIKYCFVSQMIFKG